MCNEEELTIVYIMGPGHCGSTLLCLLLNNHSEVLGLSEINKVNRDFAREKRSKSKFWEKVSHVFERNASKSISKTNFRVPYKSYKSIFRLDKCDIEEWARDNYYLLSSISKVSGINILVDSSKIWQRLYLLYLSDRFDIKVIHLMRNGKAVLNSYLRKDNSFSRGSKRWAKSIVYAGILRALFDEQNWLNIKYEKLATETESTLVKTCKLMNVEYESGMSQLNPKGWKGIGGNRMRTKGEQEIKLDESWKEELSVIKKVRFNVTFGCINKVLGY